MKDLKTKTIIRALVGAILGVAICFFMAGIGGGLGELASNPLELIRQIIGSSLLGIVSMGGMTIYEIESWGLLRTTCTHFILSLSAFLLCNSLLGWFEKDIILIVLVVWIITYFLIWLFQWLHCKSEIKKMNSDLEKMQRKEEDHHE